MGGPNLEIFKFAAYLFFPIAFMYHFGDPDWYDRHIEPKPAKDPQSLKVQLEELKSKRISSQQSESQSQPQRLV
ncbi:hypothetical protein E3P99_00543 [Wallemia hederae]|uniref:Protein PET100, mitochondrial n=1 Tax=Wallemia hederae TaxID=1540922 RepID=A0A4V4LU44_9BASI|nr:hypothetical protein E3P99_00543 [Wallemia hederae]